MAVENWIDDITRLWEFAAPGENGRLVKAFRVFEKDEFPEALTADLYPCALTYTVDVASDYGAGGPNIDFYHGRTEFHVVPSAAKSYYPRLMRYLALVRNAAAGSVKLAGKVDSFLLRADEGPSIEGPVLLQYGSEEPHLGLVVHWVVKEDVSGDFAVSA